MLGYYVLYLGDSTLNFYDSDVVRMGKSDNKKIFLPKYFEIWNIYIIFAS